MSPEGIAAAFAAGLATSIGPCAAPRYLALAAIVSGTHGGARWLRVALFTSGLLLCYALLASAAALITALIASSALIYALLALAFLVFGIRTLTRQNVCTHGTHSSGATFLTGGALGLVVAPCCTPVIAMSAGVVSASGSPFMALGGALAFAAGHVAPLATLGAGMRFADFAPAVTTVSGALSIALAAYYGLLA